MLLKQKKLQIKLLVANVVIDEFQINEAELRCFEDAVYDEIWSISNGPAPYEEHSL